MRPIDADALITTQVHTVVVLKEGREQLESVLYAEQVDDAPTVEPASPWHRVDDEPKDEGKYLVYDGRGNYHVAWWGPRLGWCYDPKFFCYWMPIEPPTETERSKT